MWFVPSSALTEEQRAQMPLEVAARMPEALHRVVKRLHQQHMLPEFSVDQILCSKNQHSAGKKLGALLEKHGSDKSTTHNYHLIYGPIIDLLGSNARILEIGLGSNDLSIASNMGMDGTPGASLRAFKEFCPQAVVDGADIDRSIEVDGCRVFHIDQTHPETFDLIRAHGEPCYDLIIDDGLHSPDANLFTLEFALSRISNNGFVVIEDINESAISIWKTLQYCFRSTSFHAFLIRTKAAYLFIATKSECFPVFF